MAYRFVEEEPQEEGFGKAALRNVSRQASNLGTRAVGLPGDIFSLINEYVARPTVKAFGQESVPYEQTALGKVLPTTETHRKGLEAHTGEYLKPQNSVESFVDDIVEDTALLFTPGAQFIRSGKTVSGTQKVARNLSKAIGAQLVGTGAEQIAGNKEAGDIAKLGSLFLLSVLDKPTAAKRVGELYKAAEKSIPEGAKTNARSLEKGMDNLIGQITKGRPKSNLSAPEKFVIQQAENVRGLIKRGEIPVDQAWAQLRTINQELQGVLPELSWSQRKGIKTQAAKINHELNATLRQYGKGNKAFRESFHPAQEASAAVAKSHYIGNWVEKNVKSPVISEGLLHLFGFGLGNVAEKAVVPYKAAQMMSRIKNSPTLRKLYAATLKEASKENAKGFNKYLSELDEKLQEEETEHKYTFID